MSAPEMKWEYSFPVVAGWYWFQPLPSEAPTIVRVIYDEGWWVAPFRGSLISASSHDVMGVRWCGPLAAPYAFEDWKP